MKKGQNKDKSVKRAMFVIEIRRVSCEASCGFAFDEKPFRIFLN